MSVNEKMTAIADAIREKTGEAGKLNLDGMATAIRGMGTGGIDKEALESAISEKIVLKTAFKELGNRIDITEEILQTGIWIERKVYTGDPNTNIRVGSDWDPYMNEGSVYPGANVGDRMHYPLEGYSSEIPGLYAIVGDDCTILVEYNKEYVSKEDLDAIIALL